MIIENYLERIGIRQKPLPDLAGLRAVHRAHIFSIPYENIDVQLGRPLTTSPEQACKKIVDGGRGGWCYEINGLLGLALSELGFKTTRLAGAVMREEHGNLALSNHLVIKVELEEGLYLGDAGFGEGSVDPVRLVPGDFVANGFKFSLTQEDGEWLRMHKFLPHGRRSFDFTLRPADESAFTSRCNELQTASYSPFVQNLLCYRHFEGGYWNVLGRVLKKVESTNNIDEAIVTERVLEDADDLVSSLKDCLGLDVPEAAELWPKIVERHEAVMRDKLKQL